MSIGSERPEIEKARPTTFATTGFAAQASALKEENWSAGPDPDRAGRRGESETDGRNLDPADHVAGWRRYRSRRGENQGRTRHLRQCRARHGARRRLGPARRRLITAPLSATQAHGGRWLCRDRPGRAAANKYGAHDARRDPRRLPRDWRSAESEAPLPISRITTVFAQLVDIAVAPAARAGPAPSRPSSRR